MFHKVRLELWKFLGFKKEYRGDSISYEYSPSPKGIDVENGRSQKCIRIVVVKNIEKVPVIIE